MKIKIFENCLKNYFVVVGAANVCGADGELGLESDGWSLLDVAFNLMSAFANSVNMFTV